MKFSHTAPLSSLSPRRSCYEYLLYARAIRSGEPIKLGEVHGSSEVEDKESRA